MASQTQGIQQLLAAEKRAAEKVSEARKRKYHLSKNKRQTGVTAVNRSRVLCYVEYINCFTDCRAALCVKEIQFVFNFQAKQGD